VKTVALCDVALFAMMFAMVVGGPLGVLAGSDGGVAKRAAQVRFTASRRAEKNHVLAVAEEPQRVQVTDLAFVERWLKREVEFFERFHDRKARRAQSLVEPFVVAGTEFVVDQRLEEFEVAELRVDGCLVMRLEDAGGMSEPQFAELLV